MMPSFRIQEKELGGGGVLVSVGCFGSQEGAGHMRSAQGWRRGGGDDGMT